MAYADNPDVQEYLRLKSQVEALRAGAAPAEELPSTNAGGVSVGNIIRNMAARKRGTDSTRQLSQLEQQLEQARIRALRGAEGQQSPEAAAVMQSVGAPDALTQAASPVQVNPTAALQAASQNPAMLPALVKAGVITEEQATQMAAQIAAQGTAKNQQAIDLQRQKDAAAMERARLKGGPAAPPAGRLVDPADPASAPIGAGLGPSQQAIQAKTLKEIQDRGRGGDLSMQRLNDLVPYLDTPEGLSAFTPAQRTISAVKEGMKNEGGGGMISTIAEAFQTEGARKIGASTIDAVLTDMQKLGGSDSNEELRTLRSRYPSNITDAATAKALAVDLQKWAQIASKATELEQADVSTGKAYRQDFQRPNYHKLAEQELSGDADTSLLDKYAPRTQ